MQMNAKQVSCLWNKDWRASTTLHSGISSDRAGGGERGALKGGPLSDAGQHEVSLQG